MRIYWETIKCTFLGPSHRYSIQKGPEGLDFNKYFRWFWYRWCQDNTAKQSSETPALIAGPFFLSLGSASMTFGVNNGDFQFSLWTKLFLRAVIKQSSHLSDTLKTSSHFKFNISEMELLLSFYKKDFIYLFLERGRERERGRETSTCGCLLHDPLTRDLSRNPSMHPRLAIAPVTLWFAGWHSIHWATPAREGTFTFLMCTLHSHLSDRVSHLSEWYLHQPSGSRQRNLIILIDFMSPLTVISSLLAKPSEYTFKI